MKRLLKWAAIGFGVLVVIVAIADAGGGDTTTTTTQPAAGVSSTDTAPSTEPVGTTAEAASAPRVGLNTEIRVGDVGWTVTAVKTTDKLESEFTDSKTTTGKFLWVDLTINNYGRKPITADDTAVSILDSQGREFKAYAESFSFIPDDKKLFLEQINPGMAKVGEVIFELPKDAAGLQLSVGDLDLWSNDQGLIDLGM